MVAIIALTGCSTTNTPSQTGPVRVIATTTQLADFSEAVAGDDGIVTALIRPNQSAHNFDPSARDLVAAGEANALVSNGLGLEPWLASVVDASGFSGIPIEASSGVTLLDDDPHVWTSPRNARLVVANIVAGLQSARPDLSATFSRNGAAYDAQLALLDTWATEALDTVPPGRRLLVTNHDALAYFVRDYDITFLGSILPALDDNAEPSAADVDALVTKIRASGAVAVFSENTVSAKLAATIAREAGVVVYSGEQALYADSLGARGSAGETYLAATIHNVTVLVTAWGGTVPPLPEGLAP
jgi:ABC-type Zn uptake system ZnuABC Zn-binding protein ZnuA